MRRWKKRRKTSAKGTRHNFHAKEKNKKKKRRKDGKSEGQNKKTEEIEKKSALGNSDDGLTSS